MTNRDKSDDVDPRLSAMIKNPAKYFEQARDRAEKRATVEVRAALRGRPRKVRASGV